MYRFSRRVRSSGVVVFSPCPKVFPAVCRSPNEPRTNRIFLVPMSSDLLSFEIQTCSLCPVFRLTGRETFDTCTQSHTTYTKRSRLVFSDFSAFFSPVRNATPSAQSSAQTKEILGDGQPVLLAAGKQTYKRVV